MARNGSGDFLKFWVPALAVGAVATLGGAAIGGSLNSRYALVEVAEKNIEGFVQLNDSGLVRTAKPEHNGSYGNASILLENGQLCQFEYLATKKEGSFAETWSTFGTFSEIAITDLGNCPAINEQ